MIKKKDGQHYKRLSTSQKELNKGGHMKQTWQKTKKGGNMFDQVHDQKITITIRRGRKKLKEKLEQGGGVYTTIINKYDQKTKHNTEGGVQPIA